MKWTLALTASLMIACGGAPRTSAHEGPDVITADWTGADDAVLEARGGEHEDAAPKASRAPVRPGAIPED